MEQRISIITLGAYSLQAMRNFYVEKFDWEPVAENKDIVFFKMNGLLFGLYGRKDLAKFHETTPEGSGFRPLTLAYLIGSNEEVGSLYTIMKNRGVKIVKEPTEPPFGGLYFLIEDIEGNVWDIAHNPLIPLDDKGNVITHKSIDQL